MTLTILLSLLLAAPTVEAQMFGLTPTSIEQAISTAWPQAARYESVVLEMKGDLRQRIAQRCGSAVPSEPVMLVRVSDAKQQWIGDAVLLDEIGKYRPITFLVAIHPEKRVHDLQVLVYREHIGKQIASPRFTRQFRNRTAQPPFHLHREIRNLSGATLSARASVRAVRRALATVAEVCDGNSPIRWKPWPLPVSLTVDGEVDRSVAVVRVRPAMGTVLRVEVYGPEAEQAISEVFDEVRRLEQLLSRWNPHSDVSRVEQAPAGHPVKVSADTIECVSAALQIARESGGAFDPTLVADGYLRIDVDRATGTITRQRDDLILDLGGIGKGYALDRAAEILRELGHSRALLDFGGQLLALDPPPGESSWLVGIHDPRVKGKGKGANSLLRSIPLVGSSLATSATYEKGDHIIDPQQGQAAVVALSTTVLIPDATRADAFSTALAVLGPDHADPLLDRVPGAGALILVAGEKSARGYGKLSP